MNRDIDIKDIFLIIKNHLLFIVSITAIFIIIAVAYLHFQTPIYRADALIKVKSETKSHIKSSMLFTPPSISNTKENVELLKTFYINQQALNLYQVDYRVKYYIKYKYKSKEIFNKIPIKIVDIEIFDKKVFGKKLTLKPTENGYTLAFKYSLKKRVQNFLFKKKLLKLKKQEFKYNQTIVTQYFKLKVNKLSNFDNSIDFKLNGDNRYIYENIIKKNLKVSQVEEDISIIAVSYSDNIRQRAILYLNSLLNSFIEDNIKNKSEQNKRVLLFIKQELNYMKKKLEISEKELENYRISNKVIKPSIQASTFIKELSRTDILLSENHLKRRLVHNITDLMKKNYKLGSIAPYLMELNEQPTLRLISYLQDSQLERAELLLELTTKHPKIRSLDSKIDALKGKINLNIKNLDKYLRQKNRNLEKLKISYESKLRTLPTKDRKLVNIKRDYEVSSKMYNFLLKKKAENEIRRVATLSDYKIIDKAYSSQKAISPKSQLIIVSFSILGLIFGTMLAYIYKNDKIKTKDDIKSRADFSIYGVISSLKNSIVKIGVYDNRNLEFSNSYRTLRTNLQLLLDKRGIKNRVILISSTIEGEGKNLTTANLSAIFQLANYKVVVIDFDLRTPTVGQLFNITDISNDICSYLLGDSNIESIIYQTKYNNLDIIPIKEIPTNPSELILSNRVLNLINELKEYYDYIIINSTPFGKIPDTRHILKYSDINLILFRQNYSKKNFISNLNLLIKENDIKNIGAVLLSSREKFIDL